MWSAMCSDSAGAYFMQRRLPHARLLHRFSMRFYCVFANSRHNGEHRNARGSHAVPTKSFDSIETYFSATESQLHMVSNRIVVVSTVVHWAKEKTLLHNSLVQFGQLTVEVEYCWRWWSIWPCLGATFSTFACSPGRICRTSWPKPNGHW